MVFKFIVDSAGWWIIAIGIQMLVGSLFLISWRKNKRNFKSSPVVHEKRLIDWEPLPLVEKDVQPKEQKIMGKISEDIFNMSATSFLSLDRDKKIIDDSIKALRKYGVGSCGPRGFYGTIDVHLELEERLANFMGVEEACVYSYGFSTIASAIPAYLKKGDLIFVDECANFAIQKGIEASRSTVYYYRHNDMSHLEELLDKFSSKILKKRSFIVAEGIYFNTGSLCPLDKLVEFRKMYKLRMILDESLTIGVLGKHGKGLTEYFNIPISEIDLIVGSLEHSFGSIGGFCVGSHFIVEHQRLSGIGYCFSASLPPLLAKAAISAIDMIENDPNILSKLNENSIKLQKALVKLNKLKVGGHELSPIKHLYIASQNLTDSEKNEIFHQIVKYCNENGFALSVAEYLKDCEKKCPEPSIRIASNSHLNDEKIDNLISLLSKAIVI